MSGPRSALQERFRFSPAVGFALSRRIIWPIVLCWYLTGCSSRHITVPIMPPLIAPPGPSLLWVEPFDALDTTRWREVEIRRHTQYHVVELDGRRCLQAKSDDGASILLTPLRVDLHHYARLSWQWRVDQLVEGEALERKEGSDAAARVYVYFDTPGLPWQKRSLDYVWSASLPVDTIVTSAFSSTSKMIVAESGRAVLGQWRTIERNIEEDYARCFGGHLPQIIAIGIMSDTDNTHGHALAYFDELRISRLSLIAEQARPRLGSGNAAVTAAHVSRLRSEHHKP